MPGFSLNTNPMKGSGHVTSSHARPGFFRGCRRGRALCWEDGHVQEEFKSRSRKKWSVLCNLYSAQFPILTGKIILQVTVTTDKRQLSQQTRHIEAMLG